MKKLFVDTNIIIDIFAERKEFQAESAQVLSMIARNEFIGYLSALSFPNLHYILKKLLGNQKAIEVLEKVKVICQIIPLDKKCIDLALVSEFNDFEDALQYYSAVSVHCDCIITRNPTDYAKADIPIFTPKEFISVSQKNAKNEKRYRNN